MYKLINKKTFYIILAAILGYWVLQIIGMIISLTNIDQAVDDLITNPIYGSVYSESDREMLRGTVTITAIIGAIIVIGLSSIFLFKLLGHRKRPQKGTYITVMLVFACIIGGFDFIYLIGGNLLSLGSVVILALVVAGYAIQKNNNLTPYADGTQPFNPYGPQNSQPYGQNQNPYGQQPYNQQYDPFGGQYQQPQNPYADPWQQPQNPPAGPYRPPQNPYGDPQQPDDKNKQ